MGPFGDVDNSPTKRFILDNRDDPSIAPFFKLAFDKRPAEELFDLRNDQAEKNNLIDTKPEIAKNLDKQLRDWQQSVLNSLTGADYR